MFDPRDPKYSYLGQVMSTSEDDDAIPEEVQKIYIKLMCQFEKEKVYHYLTGTESYPLGECLQLCRRYNVSDAEAYLLERTGNTDGALQLLLKLQLAAVDAVYEDAKVNNDEFTASNSSGQSPSSGMRRRASSSTGEVRSLPSWKRAFDLLQCIIGLCERASDVSNMDSYDRDEASDKISLLWFRVLDAQINL